MLRFIGTLARIVFGLTLASLAAGLVTVLFVDVDVLTGRFDRLPNTLGEIIDLALLAATHIAIFSFLFVAITGAIGEWFSIRALTFYLLAGVAIAMLGFSAQYASEIAGQPTILNNYAIKAFLTVGFVGGFVYWLAAGQFAGRGPEAPLALVDGTPTTEVTAEPNRGGADGVSVTITHPPTTHPASAGRQPLWRMPKLERLKFSRRDAPLSSGDTTIPSENSDHAKPPSQD